jgi:hypothetical protein
VRHRRQIPIAEAVEKIFLKHDGRPHWGKYRYLTSREYERTYNGLPAFEAVRSTLDTNGMFSAEKDMFDNLNRFERPPIGAMIRSVGSGLLADKAAVTAGSNRYLSGEAWREPRPNAQPTETGRR